MKTVLPFIFLLFILSFNLQAQRVLLIETINDPKNLKIYEGETIEYKVVNIDEWQKSKIQKFLVNDSSILMTDGLIHMDDITHFRQYRPIINYISAALKTFGTAWLVYAGLGALSGNYTLGTDTYVIGGTSIGLGWGLKKLFYKRTLPMGKRYRLRLIDLTMSLEP